MGGTTVCWLQAVRSSRGSQGARKGVGRSGGLWRECDRWGEERGFWRVGGSEGEEGQLEVEGGWDGPSVGGSAAGEGGKGRALPGLCHACHRACVYAHVCVCPWGGSGDTH